MAINNKLNRTDLIKKLGKYPTGNICNAHSKVRAMDNRIAALSPGMKLAGPAKTVRARQRVDLQFEGSYSAYFFHIVFFLLFVDFPDKIWL